MKVTIFRLNVAPYLLAIALALGLMVSLIGFATPVSAAVPVAVADFYAVDMNTPLTILTPGVLKNDTDADDHVLTATKVTDPTHGTVILNPDGSFTYTPETGYFGTDSFTYQACDTTTPTPLCSTATVSIVVTAAESYACTTDQDGSNDATEQADLNSMCTDVNPDNDTSVGVTWSWDSIYGTGANSYYACALFDTDGDGNINTAVCIQMFPDSTAGNIMKFSKAEYFTCSDAKPDRCTQPSAPLAVEYCSTYSESSDPFDPTNYPLTAGTPGGAGSDYPDDMVGNCTIPTTALPNNASLKNVCSFTSVANPNSNPTDCVAPAEGVRAYLTLIKDTTPDVSSVKFDFSILNSVGDSWLRSITTGTSGSGTSDRILVPAGTYSVEELMSTMPAGWELLDIFCYELNAPTTEIGTGTNPVSSIPIASYDDVYCTFTNAANIDLEVTKSDGDYPGHGYLYPGASFNYTITVVYNPPGTGMGTGAIATDVVMTDTLDDNVTYNDYTINSYTTPSSPACGYVSATHDFQCTSATMTAGQTYTVTVIVTVDAEAPMDGTIETGTCSFDALLGYYWGTTLPYDNPLTPEIGDMITTSGKADLCNLVTVGTSAYEHDESNNDDSEPSDVGLPTEVNLMWFDLTDVAKRSITLGWETASETHNAGFNIYRATTLDGIRVKLNDVLIPSNTYPGSPVGAEYVFVDETVRPRKTYYYWLEAVDLNGSTVFFGPVSAQALAAKK